jgi:hypothetical protein
LIRAGDVRDWEGQKTAIEEAGFEIVREREYLVVRHEDHKRNIRLKGALYNEHEFGEILRGGSERATASGDKGENPFGVVAKREETTWGDPSGIQRLF